MARPPHFLTLYGMTSFPHTFRYDYPVVCAGKTIDGTFPKEGLNGVAYESKLAFFDLGLPNGAGLSVPNSLSRSMFPLVLSVTATTHRYYPVIFPPSDT